MNPLGNEPQWYRDAVIYQVHVRAFQDSDGDGIGDFRGLTERLDYIQDLGVTAIWLQPFYPSPLKDDGYDIAAHRDVHPSYGTLRDFRRFLREAHARGLRVITEMVLNHTSDQHEWFQRARRAPAGSRHRNWYVWSDTPDEYPGVRIIFQDFEPSNWAWDPVAQQYFWHRFYSNQPDLNYDSADVRRAMFGVVDFWLEMGVDGLRLDAVPYLYERNGTNCENLPETHAYLRALRKHIDAKFPDRMLLAEANMWPEDAVQYFGDSDECHMAFHFPLMPRMFMATKMEDRFPVVDILTQTPALPEGAQWAIFLRNHDELTLEMVTDEERDYMYRVFADDPQARINLGIRRRLAPLLGNDRRLIEMMNGLLFSLPGTPVVYYGDEVGMGDNFYLGDRNGVRTPMQWSADRNAGFSRANPQQLYLPVVSDPEYGSVNVEAQHRNPNSLLWHMRRLIALRKRHSAFGRGSFEFVPSENRKVLTYLRSDEHEDLLVVANLSRLAQYVELDLSRFKGRVPSELLGHTPFPPIGDLPYLLTLGPHAIYWFALQPERDPSAQDGGGPLPALRTGREWTDIVETARGRQALERALVPYLPARRWFSGKGSRISGVRLGAVIPVPEKGSRRTDLPAGVLALIDVDYAEGDPETYLLPLTARATHGRPDEELPRSAIARLSGGDEELVLFDAAHDTRFAHALLDAVVRRRRLPGAGGEVSGWTSGALKGALDGQRPEDLEPRVAGAEQSNTSIAYGDRLLLKLYRKLEEGPHPEVEVGRYLTERASFEHVAPTLGALEYRRARGRTVSLGMLAGWVPNEGDAWGLAVDEAQRFLEGALATGSDNGVPAGAASSVRLTELVDEEPPPHVAERIGYFLEQARRLGQRTAQLHLALAAELEDPAFTPEPFSAHYRRSLYQSLRGRARPALSSLRRGAAPVPGAIDVLQREDEVLGRFQAVTEASPDNLRIRVHGDYHLGQVLWTGRDFVIVDFEGEPARPLGERRIKRSPLQDVAGMMRSFHYAAYAALLGSGGLRSDDEERLGGSAEMWLLYWYRWVTTVFLRAYLEAADGAAFLPASRADLDTLLDAFQLEKAVYELRYEVANRPEWVPIPLQGVRQLLESGA
jgi:maltose alpha-D-glucosyltransferase/alpha-amylase